MASPSRRRRILKEGEAMPRRTREAAVGAGLKPAPTQQLSIIPDARLLHDGSPALCFLADERGKLRRRHANREESGGIGLRLDLWIGQNLRDLALELVDDRGRRSFGCDKAEPDRDLIEMRQSQRTRKRRNVRSRRKGAVVEFCQDAELSALHQRHGGGGTVIGEIDA